jgi:hypothetical protein
MEFGVRQFELALMYRMRDLNTERVAAGVEAMGASRAELRAAHTQWTRMIHVRKGAAPLRAALGPPAHRGPQPFGSLTCEVLRWALPSWPGLEYEALLGPDGGLWNQWFVRPGAPAVVTFEELTAWRCVVADVQASFPGAAHREGQAPHHWAVDFTHEGAAYRARFVYGLYQRLDRVGG